MIQIRQEWRGNNSIFTFDLTVMCPLYYCVMCRDADASPIYTFMHDGFY